MYEVWLGKTGQGKLGKEGGKAGEDEASLGKEARQVEQGTQTSSGESRVSRRSVNNPPSIHEQRGYTPNVYWVCVRA